MRLFIISFLLAAELVFPQDSTGFIKRHSETIFNDAMLYFENCGAFFISPLHADTEEWLYTAAVTGTTLLMITQDDEIRKRMGRNTLNPRNNDFWDIPTAYGVVEYSNVLNVAVYAAGLFTENEHVRITGRIMLETITVSGLSALLLRYITGRERPPYTDDHLAFKWFGTTERFQAFPSGHAVVGCALSTVLAERIDTWWSRVFFYGIAGLSSYVRILNNQHWASDVFIGSILGFGAGYYMLNREEKRVETGNKSGISFFPGINGINIIYSF